MSLPVRIERTVSLAWEPDAAFVRLTTDPMMWWPWNPREARASRIKRIGFEQKAGGTFFQEHSDGHFSELGEVREWDPPRHIALSFRPPNAPDTEEHVELDFAVERAGTSLTLRASSRRHPWRVRAPRQATRNAQSAGLETDPHRARRALIHLMQAVVLIPLAVLRAKYPL